jgi:PAS domain S-box-containing protein
VPTGGTQRIVTLPPAPDSARHARRFVADVLTAAGAGEYVDIASLLTSELVTNGIVHAHTELQVVAEATPTWVRVEVTDGNPTLPARRSYADDALTGRGLEMVELLADELGVTPLENDGKRVWFRLGAAPRAPAMEGAEGTDGSRGTDAPAEYAPALAVVLCRLPVELYCAWQQHAEAALREAVLASLDEFGPAIPQDFTMATEALGSLAGSAEEVFALLDRGVDQTDFEVRFAPSVSSKFPILRDVLERCGQLAVTGQLLLPPPLPEIQAVRGWVCDEVARQAAGLPPQPWEALSGEDLPAFEVSADALAAVRTATVPQIAADRGNRIVAVSTPAAELLGWKATELEGRRLVVVIPPRLRDAHVAGFTRHLLGGGARMIGSTVPVPALHHDGHEVAVDLHIERWSDPAATALFVATLTPRE